MNLFFLFENIKLKRFSLDEVLKSNCFIDCRDLRRVGLSCFEFLLFFIIFWIMFV